jgi:serine/threonine protein kinase
MAWTAGSRVGGYEIIGLLGAGGMGEVYRARDLRLQREIALKILPVTLIQDPERRARFEREARLLASLNHPNIAGIFGIEDADGPDGPAPVLVLEFVDGQNLADRIGAGTIPVDEVIAIALQVAEALEAAHDRGIIHRDLKPANVLLTRDVTAKVLDFGLAKALDADPNGRSDPAQSPTFTSASTQAGVIMGTAAYMAPEQARGKAVDRRADIWAFGALLFEMLSGSRAFPGETVSDTLAALLTREPEWTSLPKATPPAIVALLRRCLERDPRERLQSIGEARIVLSNPSRAIHTAATLPPVSRRLSPLAVAVVALAVVTLTGAAVTWWMRAAKPSGEGPLRRLDFALEGADTALDHIPVLSPDGSRIAYTSGGSLWTRSLSEFASRQIPRTAGAAYPFWAPDSQNVAFVVDGKLWRAPVKDGEPELVGAVPPDMTGSGAGVWTAAGNFVVVGSDQTGLTEISGKDGTSREILALDRKRESDFHEISELPNGRGLLFTTHTGQGADTIGLLANGKRHEVLKLAGETLRSPVYDPGGYVVFSRETPRRGVWAVPFSLDSLATTGAPFLVDAAGNYPSVGSDGTLAMIRRSDRPSEVVWLDRSGSVTLAGTLPGQAMEAGPWTMMRLSPDEQKVAIALAETTGSELWVHDLKRGITSPLSRGAQMAVWPTWLPDSSRILFGAFAGARSWSVQSVSANETSTPTRLLAPVDEPQWPCSISPDGKWLLYAQNLAATDLWIASVSNPSDGKPLMTTPAREQEGHFSPDGRWIAYISDESGRFELYVRRFPIGSDRLQISNRGVGAVNWTAGGHELVYRVGADVMSVSLTEKDGRLDVSPPQRLFSVADPAISRSFAVTADGRRFLFARATGGDRISVVLNWARTIPR